MKYIFDTKIVAKAGLTIPEFMFLLFVKSGGSLNKELPSLTNKGAYISDNITPRWSDICDKVLLDSEKAVPTDGEMEGIALKMMEIFPTGKKPGTQYYWRGNKREILLKLRTFFKLYGSKYTEEEILDATYRYVDSFHGDYKFMRLLKYFIWKKDEGEEISELATFIDNAGQEDSDDSSWVTELR